MTEVHSAVSSVDSLAGGITREEDSDLIILVYLLFVIGYVFPMAPLAGGIIALFKGQEAEGVSKSHFSFQIRTFLFGLGFLILTGLGFAANVYAGGIVLGIWVLWNCARCIKGFLLIREGKAIDEPKTLLL